MNPHDEMTTMELAIIARVARKTVWCWMTHGITVNGVRVRLDFTKSGRRYRIPREAWEKFRRETSGRDTPPVETPAERTSRNEAALKRLHDLGVKL